MVIKPPILLERLGKKLEDKDISFSFDLEPTLIWAICLTAGFFCFIFFLDAADKAERCNQKYPDSSYVVGENKCSVTVDGVEEYKDLPEDK